MAFTNLDSLQRREEMNNRLRASANRLNPLFGQQQQQSNYSLPMGGGSFMRGNQIGGQSSINVYKTPGPELTPEELEAQQFENRAAQYQQELSKFNLGQREAELEKQRAEAEEIASGRNMLNGRAVTRAEMDEYQRGVKQSGARAQADFARENPFYAATRASMEPAPTRRKDNFGRFIESEKDYSNRLEEYLSPANKQAREQQFLQKLNTARTNALTNSISQFRNDPMGYLLGGGKEGASTYSPDALMGYLGQANQLFKATGQEGNFMDFMLGNTSSPAPQSSPAPLRQSNLRTLPQRAYRPGTSYASQGFQAPQSNNPPAFYSMPKRNSRQQPAPRRTGTMGFAIGGGGGGGYGSGIAATNASFLGL